MRASGDAVGRNAGWVSLRMTQRGVEEGERRSH